MSKGLVPRQPARVNPARPGHDRTMMPVLASQEAGNNQYAVLLLNEEQVSRLLNRPMLRPINQLPGGTVFASYTRLLRRARVATVVLAVLIAGASAWAWAPLPGLSSLSWGGGTTAPTIFTGASFSLTLASARPDAAADMVRRLEATGVPAFVRGVPGSVVRQVMVGPFVSLDEAESEQRRLARSGYGSGRVFVDDTLRNIPKSGRAAPPDMTPAVVMVGAGEQVSLAMELRTVPRQVRSNRAGDGTLVVEVGPIDYDVDAQEWSVPAGVALVDSVAIDEVRLAPDARQVRATLTLPATTLAHTRVEGRRVYIDLMRARETEARATGRRVYSSSQSVTRPPTRIERAPAAPASSAAAPAAAAAPASAAPAAAVVAAPVAPGEQLRPLFAKFDRLVPFLQSAGGTPSPDVLRALASSVDELEASLRQVVVTPEVADAHGALTSAVVSARRVVDAGFAGDRVTEARQMAMLVGAARSAMPNGRVE